jgi:hypothetical protein
METGETATQSAPDAYKHYKTYPTQAARAYPAFTNEPCAPAIKPLECGGDTSEKYVGIAVKTCPTDTPVMTRAAKYWNTVRHKQSHGGILTHHALIDRAGLDG